MTALSRGDTLEPCSDRALAYWRTIDKEIRDRIAEKVDTPERFESSRNGSRNGTGDSS
jgi:hypothetical protein